MKSRYWTTRLLAASLLTLPSWTANAQFISDGPVISGGVGEVERAEMQQLMGKYNLHLGFARQDGAFLAGVDVSIRDNKGKIVWSGTSGPLLFARLAPGTYQVVAEHEGKTQRRTLKVGPGQVAQMHYVHLPIAAEPIASPSATQGAGSGAGDTRDTDSVRTPSASQK